MKKFLLSTFFFCILAAVCIAVLFFIANKKADPFYLRFTTPQQSSLILGTSRAAQGLQPAVFNQALNRNDIYNYAFSINHSPYGPAYLESIKRKLKQGTKNGIFILAVDPWSLAGNSNNPDDVKLFSEEKLALKKVKNVTTSPNISYFMFGYDQQLWNMFKPNQPTTLHDDGWLELKLQMDSGALVKRIADRVKEYSEVTLPKYAFSKTRLEYLKQTITFLKEHGKVYLVRLPVHPDMMAVDNALMPSFNELMFSCALEMDVRFLDMTPLNHRFLYHDGNHLYSTSGKQVSAQIANWILSRG